MHIIIVVLFKLCTYNGAYLSLLSDANVVAGLHFLITKLAYCLLILGIVLKTNLFERSLYVWCLTSIVLDAFQDAGFLMTHVPINQKFHYYELIYEATGIIVAAIYYLAIHKGVRITIISTSANHKSAGFEIGARKKQD